MSKAIPLLKSSKLFKILPPISSIVHFAQFSIFSMDVLTGNCFSLAGLSEMFRKWTAKE